MPAFCRATTQAGPGPSPKLARKPTPMNLVSTITGGRRAHPPTPPVQDQQTAPLSTLHHCRYCRLRASPLDSVDVALASSSYRSMPPSRGSHLGMLGPQILPLPSAHLRELRFGKARATSVEAREHLFHSPNSTKGSGLGMIEIVRAALERSTRDLLIHHVRQPRPFAAIATRSAPNASHPDP